MTTILRLARRSIALLTPAMTPAELVRRWRVARGEAVVA